MATIEAMKMEAAITAPVAGTVQRLALGSVQQVEGGDLVLVIDPASHELALAPARCAASNCDAKSDITGAAVRHVTSGPDHELVSGSRRDRVGSIQRA